MPRSVEHPRQPEKSMNDVQTVEGLSETLEDIYNSESRRILATLIRLLGNFDLAEDALQDAFAAAAKQWPRDGVPANPRAWLVSAGRFKAIDALRRRSRFEAALAGIAERFGSGEESGVSPVESILQDDGL